MLQGETDVLCALRRHEVELDCGVHGVRGELTVVADTVALVDPRDGTVRPLRDGALATGSTLDAPLPDTALVADQATATRLPVVVPGANVLRLWPLVVVAFAAVAGVPAAKLVRRRFRRRSPPRAAVVNAWRDTRDVLRDHGVAVPPGGTVRDGRPGVGRRGGNPPIPARSTVAASAAGGVRGHVAALTTRSPPSTLSG